MPAGNAEFLLVESTGQLNGLRRLDRDSNDISFNLTILAEDDGFPRQITTVDLYVSIYSIQSGSLIMNIQGTKNCVHNRETS